jgi:hypothetical protein
LHDLLKLVDRVAQIVDGHRARQVVVSRPAAPIHQSGGTR